MNCTIKKRSKLRNALLFTAAALALAACTTRNPAPVVDRAPPAGTSTPSTPSAPPVATSQPVPNPSGRAETYTVKPRDTLYQIALDHGHDYRDIAAWNQLTDPNVIRVGQVLRVVPPAGAATPGGVEVRPVPPPGTAPATAAGTVASSTAPKTEPNVAKRPYSEDALAKAQTEGTRPATPPPVATTAPASGQPAPATPPPPAAATPPPAAGDIAWAWPTNGRVIGTFNEATNKGVDLAARVGDAVGAAAAGKVIYVGSGLRGYGQMIIIRHNPEYLSAYAHNSKILVKQDQVVKQGEKIAEAGATDADQPKLHFEIRQQGKPVDPQRFLPRR
jgi:lipoprotein NlpD